MENQIEWTVTNEILEKDIDERLEVFLAEGTDKQGNKYTGLAEFVCGEFEGIKDIEEARIAHEIKS